MSVGALSLLAAAIALGAARGSGSATEGVTRRERLRFDPTTQVARVKDLYIGHELALESMGQTRDDGPFRAEKLSGWISSWLKVTAEDRYLQVEDGRPTRFLRSYTDLGGGGKLRLRPEGSPRQREEEAVLVSPLRERSVEFLWVDEEGEWSRCWSRLEADEEWLAGIHGDMDMLALLPPGEVAQGDSWELSPEALGVLLAPGGNHLITPRTPNLFSRMIEVGVGGDFSEILGPQVAGACTARFEGVREEDGARLAVVSLRIAGLHSIVDRTDLWRLSMPIEERREEARLVSALLECTLDAEGELLWDLGGGHVHSVELSGQERFVLDLTKRLPTQDGFSRIGAQSAFSGTLSLRLEVRPGGAR